MLDVSIIILSFNTKRLLVACLQSIKEHTRGVEYEVIVVDNASTDGSAEMLRKLKAKNAKLKVIFNKENAGYARANNQGIRKAKGRYILFLNSDTKLVEDSLTKMVMWMDKHPEVGAASCALVNEDGSIQPNGGSFPDLLRVFLWLTFLDDIPGLARVFGSYHTSAAVPISRGIYRQEHQKDWISGAVFLLRRKVFEKIGGFDEDFFMYTEDVEYCFRIKKAGWGVWYTPSTRILHVGFGSGKGGTVRFARAYIGKEGGIIGEFKGLKAFYRKHYPRWQHPVLSLFIKLGALLRMLVFGLVGRQGEAWRIYAKALVKV